MARSTVETLFKKNSKLESFLKKSLNDETYERVRAYESCIIVSEKENKALKYVILGDEWIYLTENPPKNVVEEVSLKDIISVDHVNDYPDFLSGEERENTQHLVVTYWTNDSKRRSIRRSKRSPRPGSAATEGERSNASTPLGFASSQDYGNLSEDYGYITQSMSSLQISGRPDSRGSIGSVREAKGGSKKKKRLSESLEESFNLKSLKEEREDHLLDIEENNELNLSSNSYLQKPLPKRESGKNKRLRKPSGDSVKSNETISSRQGLLGINQSTSDLGSSVNGLLLGTDNPGERRKMVLNIYLLNLHSPMLMLIRSAWSNYLIRCTLMLDPDYEKAFRSSIVRGQQIQREKMEALFNQLKRELLNLENTMEDSFNLLNELRVATERNFALKKMFWKNTDMFLFLVNQLQHYLPKSPVNVNTEHGRSQRCDELELTILLTEIMSLMFRESEIIPARIQTLKAERGRPVFDLLKVLICTPEVPEKMAAPSDSDREIDKQVLEFTKVALQTVFELFLMAKQANWGFNEGNFFNISWMVKTLEEMRTVELFVEKTIDIMMKMIRPPRTDVLSPSEAVLLYSIFSVLQTLLEYSPKIANYIKSHYHEEFKYFVQAPSIMKKLPSNYPLCNLTLSLLDKVMNMVVEAQTTSSFPKSPR
ncbi:uncharacterized protein C12orf56-like isoform X2 [Mytilus galloprovincialis]|uniref:Uncharacterized protein n=1 Tax=Mytilus galloprovincialis TaxID=29158 RepID=A0A8B6H510_MYTGA|nr:Hypothetical predicted protein [Mytilus galloprovincialis]